MGELGTSTQTTESSFEIFFFSIFVFGCGPVPPPPLEWNSILPLVAAVLITPKGAEPPGNHRIGVIGALVLILSLAGLVAH